MPFFDNQKNSIFENFFNIIGIQGRNLANVTFLKLIFSFFDFFPELINFKITHTYIKDLADQVILKSFYTRFLMTQKEQKSKTQFQLY